MNASHEPGRRIKAKNLNKPKEKNQNINPKKRVGRKRKMNKENDIPDDIKAKLAEINDIDENYELHVVKCSKVDRQESFLSPDQNNADAKVADYKFTQPTQAPLIKLPSAIGTSTPSLAGRKDRRPVPAELSKIDGSYENQMFEISHHSKNEAVNSLLMKHASLFEEPIISQEFSKKFQPLRSNSNFSTGSSTTSRIEISRDNIFEPKLINNLRSVDSESCAQKIFEDSKNSTGRAEYLGQNSILLRSRRVICFENPRSRNPSNEDMFNPSKSGDFTSIISKTFDLSEKWAEKLSGQLSLKDRSHILRQYANGNRRLTRKTATRALTPSFEHPTNEIPHTEADKSSKTGSRCAVSFEKICSPVLISEEAHAVMPFEEVESPNVDYKISVERRSHYVTEHDESVSSSNHGGFVSLKNSVRETHYDLTGEEVKVFNCGICLVANRVEQSCCRNGGLGRDEVSMDSTNLSVVSHTTNMTCKSTTRLMSRLSLSEACSPYLKANNSLIRKNFCDPKAVVYAKCGQPDGPVTWSEVFSPRILSESVKIGEGTYGEVFLITNEENESVAIKVVPIEGDFNVNDETQKTYEEILPEILIATEMSNLRDAEISRAPNFLELKGVSCIQGAYPDELIRAWDKFKKENISENDRPDIFNGTQLFIVFQFANGGIDLEKINLKSIEEAKSIMVQLILSLAVAENALQFEHRDLHIGNVLVKETEESILTYVLNDRRIRVRTCGVQAFIIDFTNSRLSRDGITIFTDLSTDETLFNGDGDYQFEVYRLMKHINENKWKPFEPQTNLLWLIYLLDKFVQFKKYRNRKMTKKQSLIFEKMREVILSHASTQDIVNGDTDYSFINELLLKD